MNRMAHYDWDSNGAGTQYPLLYSLLSLQHSQYCEYVEAMLLDQTQPVPSNLKTNLIFFGKIA